ncbi:MAG TPA: hypothetical protein VIK04_19530 [Solirubrobacteraceae bacterium]
MSNDDPQVKPSGQRGGATPGRSEADAKGEWAATAQDGVIPAKLGGSDAPREMLDDDPQLTSSVLGETTGSREPATSEGIDSAGGDAADAVTDGGATPPAAGEEPDLRDAAAGPRQSDRESARESDG